LKNIRKVFLPVSRPDVGKDEINEVAEVLRSGWWTTGPKVKEFENAIVAYLKDDEELYAVAVSSCTAALHLSLLALDIKEGDEVIVPTWTFAATGQVVEWVGAKPVLCDIEEGTLNIDLYRAEQLVTPKTKAIIPVHMAGYPCDMEGIKRFALKHKLKVIEDAAHAIGTRYNGRKIGNFSDLTAFSFYATKNLAMGEGGMVVSRNIELIERIGKLSYFGINKNAFKRYEKTGSWFYDIEENGYKYNLDDIHAALGLVQLRKLDRMIQRRRNIAAAYKEELKGIVEFTKDSDNHLHSYHIFPIKIRNGVVSREVLITKLKEFNIGTSVHFIPLHLHSFYKSRFNADSFPVANKVFQEVLSIPMFPAMSDNDVKYVSSKIKQILSGG
jgi:perosamine synthetase